jgi:co-chaperonin GroES (HSP10)
MTLPQPTGYRLLIKPVEVKTATASGLALPEQAIKAQEHLRYIGQVVAMGPEAYQHEKFAEPWCQVGDWVAPGQYAGQELQVRNETNNAAKFRLINDDEVLAKVDPATMMVYDV